MPAPADWPLSDSHLPHEPRSPRYGPNCTSLLGVDMGILPSGHIRPVMLRVLALAVIVTLAGGCSSSTSASTSNTASGSDPSGHVEVVPSFYTPPRPLPGAPAGTLIRSQLVKGVPGVPAGATVWRILFHSTTIYGADIAESGYVVAPGASAPAAGFPMIAWAHGTTGFAAPCAPSLFTNFRRWNGSVSDSRACQVPPGWVRRGGC